MLLVCDVRDENDQKMISHILRHFFRDIKYDNEGRPSGSVD